MQTLPINTIICSTSVLDGWQICDGQNDTPDLRDRFIVSSGNLYNIDDSGGVANVTLSIDAMSEHTHSHTAMVTEINSHNHTFSMANSPNSGSVSARQGPYSAYGVSGANSSSAGPSHTHSITVSSISTAGSGTPHENRPPYYACYYLQLKQQLNMTIPSKTIVMWQEQPEIIPNGWLFCDGQNGTPDLTDRFVFGATENYELGKFGGTVEEKLENDQIGAHTHSIDISFSLSGAHTHTVPSGTGSATSGLTRVSTNQGGTATATTNTVDTVGGHTHAFSLNIQSTGGDQPHENRPPYYALAYIMAI